MKAERDARAVWLRYSSVLGDWVTCMPTDAGALQFVHLEKRCAQCGWMVDTKAQPEFSRDGD